VLPRVANQPLPGAWGEDPASPFHGLVDMERVALMGHSRGGEAAAVAAAMASMSPTVLPGLRPWPTGLDVDAVVGIAPCDGQWTGAGQGGVKLSGVDYLTIQGGLDADMAWWSSLRQLARTDVTADPDDFKAGIWIRRANHGRFNTTWDLGDLGTQGEFLVDQASILWPRTGRRWTWSWSSPTPTAPPPPSRSPTRAGCSGRSRPSR
jgi:pimeloyl-ACP methyl ester carboxylesterase